MFGRTATRVGAASRVRDSRESSRRACLRTGARRLIGIRVWFRRLRTAVNQAEISIASTLKISSEICSGQAVQKKAGQAREFRTGKMRRSAGTNKTRRTHRTADCETREKHEIVRITGVFCQLQTGLTSGCAQNAQARGQHPSHLHSTGKNSEVSPAPHGHVISRSPSPVFAGDRDCSLHSAFTGKSLTPDCAFSTVPTRPLFTNRRFPVDFA